MVNVYIRQNVEIKRERERKKKKTELKVSRSRQFTLCQGEK